MTGGQVIPAARPAAVSIAGIGERVVPLLVAAEGDRAALRYVEFFTAQIGEVGRNGREATVSGRP